MSSHTRVPLPTLRCTLDFCSKGLDDRVGLSIRWACEPCITHQAERRYQNHQYFLSLSYKVDPHTGYIDYDKLEQRTLDCGRKILICGGSSYPRKWDYAGFRQISDKSGAVLMCDMAHISGLVASKIKARAGNLWG